jgi:hypothetical protein
MCISVLKPPRERPIFRPLFSNHQTSPEDRAKETGTHNPQHAFNEHAVVASNGAFLGSRSMISGAIRSHAASLKTKRSITPKTASQKAALNLICASKGILRVHTT